MRKNALSITVVVCVHTLIETRATSMYKLCVFLSQCVYKYTFVLILIKHNTNNTRAELKVKFYMQIIM